MGIYATGHMGLEGTLFTLFADPCIYMYLKATIPNEEIMKIRTDF